METNNYFKVLGIFLLGWTFSGFGLTQMLDTQQTKVVKTVVKGVPLTLNLSLLNADNTPATAGLRVDIAQCSKKRTYDGSNSSCQAMPDEAKNTMGNMTIRESQYTNASGYVTFTSNYPDKYTLATSHLHVMVYDRFNTLIASSQLEYPTAVYGTVNDYYAAGGTNPVSISNATSLMVTGTNRNLVASRTIYIPGNASGIGEINTENDEIGDLKVFPNPVINSTTFAFYLTQTSTVAITVTDGSGTQVRTVFTDNLMSGQHEIEVDLGGLPKGIYYYRLDVNNKNGATSETKKLVKA